MAFHDFPQVHWTIGLVTAFYTLVMTLGYTYGVCTGGGVSDNILNNFGVDDMLMNTGRLGLAVTILVSFPLLTVPLIGTLVRAHKEITSECGWLVYLCFHLKFRKCFTAVVGARAGEFSRLYQAFSGFGSRVVWYRG